MKVNAREGKTETCQVLIAFKGPIPESLDLKTWGIFDVRPYVPEPLRCFKCQMFGHHQSVCRRTEKCGVCAQPHPTKQCLDKIRNKEKVEAKCANCGGKHHTWNPTCPQRNERMQGKLPQRTPATPKTPVPATRPTFVWGQQQRHAFQPRPQSAPVSAAPVAASMAEFPSLPAPVHAPVALVVTRQQPPVVVAPEEPARPATAA